MKIDTEKFKELTQNDRVEFLLRFMRLEDKYRVGEGIVYIINFCRVALMFLMIFDIYVLIHAKIFIFPPETMVVIIYLFFIMFLIVYIFEIFLACKKRKYVKELQEEFVKLEPKKKK